MSKESKENTGGWRNALPQKDPNKPVMTYEEAGDKGKAILARFVDIWNLIEWAEQDELGDPYIKVTFYKSGKMLVENYKDAQPSEFNIDQIQELSK